MKKIAWIHSHYYNWMGGHKFILETIKRLRNYFEIELIIQNGSEKNIKKFSDIGIIVHNLKSISTNSNFFWLFLPFLCNKDALKIQKILDNGRFDSIITSMFPMNYITTKLEGVNVFQYCYEPFFAFWDKEMIKTYGMVKRFFLFVLKIIYGNYDKLGVTNSKKVFTLSKVTKKQIYEIYGKESIITYEGVDSEFFKPTKNAIIFNKYKDNKIIFHTTDFTPIKKTDIIFDLLPEIVKKIPNVKILISNTLNNDYLKQKYSNFAKKYGVENNFEFLGFLDYELLPVYYTLSDLSFQPSVNQPQSLSVKEALACGIPVIRGYAEEVEFEFDDEVGYSIDVNNRELLLEKIIEILNYDENRKKEISEKARKLVIKKFTWENVANKIKEFII